MPAYSHIYNHSTVVRKLLDDAECTKKSVNITQSAQYDMASFSITSFIFSVCLEEILYLVRSFKLATSGAEVLGQKNYYLLQVVHTAASATYVCSIRS